MKSNKNIVLIGMMGSGKSSIGKILSKKLNLTFIDIDQKIEENENSKISEIFTKYGEKYFRKIEEKISLKFLSSENSVISLGGGGFINASIRKMCKKNCLSFWLDWKNETIIKRIEKRKIIEKRIDDDLNTILKRYDTYMETTKPVLDFYSKNSNFHEIDGTLKIDEITAKIDTFINF